MRIIKKIIGNPLWILLFVTTITFAIPKEFTLEKDIAIVSFMGISLLLLIFNRQWVQLILGFLCYCIFFVSIIFLSIFDSIAEPNYSIGDKRFYREEIFKTSKVQIPDQLNLIAKIDTIFYGGMEGEYDAECLYSGNSKAIIKLEKHISSQKDFIKVEDLDEFPTKVITKNNFKLSDFNSIFRKENDGHYVVHIAFNRNHTRFYYKSWYY
jgi:hypothetical protein